MLGLGLAGAAFAEQAAPDCAAPVTQSEMTFCAVADWRAADGDLNAAYVRAVAAMRAVDAGLDPAARGAESALRAAQRAWIVVRDRGCEAEGFVARGGSMEPMLVAACMAALTRARTADLTLLADIPR